MDVKMIIGNVNNIIYHNTSGTTTKCETRGPYCHLSKISSSVSTPNID